MKDFTYALRFLRNRLLFSSVAVVVMALGISLTATMYAIIEGVVLGGPDYVELDRIAFLQTTIPQSQFFQDVRIHDYLDWKDQEAVFDAMAAWYGWSVTLSGDGDRAERFSGSRVTASTFGLLGVSPFMGRNFTDDEDLATDVDLVILGYHVWVNRYDSDPDIIGKTLRLNARPTTVIGVMPDGFRFPETQDMWLPLSINASALGRREGPGLRVIARMSDGVTLGGVRSQIGTVAQRLEEQYPELNHDIVPVVRSWKDEQFVDAETKGILYTMFVAVFGVLLIACANVANLLFGLSMARGKELAVRIAMGADRLRVIRQSLLESLILASVGALVGVGLTHLSLIAFARTIAPLTPPAWMTFEMSSNVLLFVIGVTVFAAFAAGLLPALHATRSDVAGVLRDSGRGGSSRNVNRVSTALVTLEVALSCALLIGAGLTVRSTLAVGSNGLGVRKEGVLTGSLSLPSASYPDAAARVLMADQIHREIAALPGVASAALSSSLPGMGTSNNWYGVRDRDYVDDSEYSFAGLTSVTPDFFELLEVPVFSGRAFDARDAAGSDLVVIVDQRFVDRNWPGQDPLGRQVRTGRTESEAPWMTVVGVVGRLDMAQASDFGGQPPEGMFVPAAQRPMGGFSVTIRSTEGLDPLLLASPLRDLIARLDGDIPVASVQTLERRLRDLNMEYVIIGGMFSIFGVVALGLASVGLYAVMAFSVARRQTEVGVRMAMGAEPRAIVRLILTQGSKPLALGIAVGVGLAFPLGKALSSTLYGVSAADPLTFVGIPVLLALVSLAALLVPARRASRIAPVVALRED